MKTLKYLFAFALPVLAMVAMSSCSEEEASYTPAGAVSGAQVFFHSDNATAVNLASTDGGSFDVVVSRQDTTEALNIPLAMIVDDSLQAAFTAPEAIAFAAGEATTTVSVAYNASLFEAIGYADYKTVILSIDDDENTTAYGISSIEISVGFPEPWSEWVPVNAEGTGTYTYTNFFNGVDPDRPVYYREYMLNDTDAQFKVEGVYYGVDLIIDYNRQTGNCQVKPQYTGYDNSTGPIYVSDMPHFMSNNPSLTYEKYPCTYNKETGTFSLTTIYTVKEYIDTNKGSYWGTFGPEIIQLDGFYVPDATVALEYKGIFAGSDGMNSAIVGVELGVDADSVRVAMVTKLDNAALTAVLKGTTEYQLLEKGGFVTFPVESTGTYNVIAVTYMGGEAAEYNTLTFDAIVGGGSIYDMLEGASIEDYEGEWVFENTYNGKVYQAVGNISAVEAEDGNTYLLCQGFADAASNGYTSDEFLLIYDAETGLVTLPTPQQCADFSYQGEDFPILLVLSNSEEMTVFGGSVIGGFVDGKIKFLNAEDNQNKADSFVFYSQDLGLISYFNALEWTRYEGGAEEAKVAAPAKAREFGNAKYVKNTKKISVIRELESNQF